MSAERKTIKVQRANKIALLYAIQSLVPDLNLKPIEYRMISKPSCPLLQVEYDSRITHALRVFNQVFETVTADCTRDARDPEFKPSLDALADAARKG